MRKSRVGWALALAGALILVFLAQNWKDIHSPDYPPSVAPMPESPWGVNFEPGDGDLAAQMSKIAGAGFRLVRVTFPWAEIEPRRGKFRWERWDALVEAAERHHVELVAVLDTSPKWARSPEDTGNRFAPPQDWRDFGGFVSAVASRYRNDIRWYQIWHEPNIAPHWGARPVDPAAYVRLLREGYIAVHSANPAAHVLMASLAPNVEPGGTNQSDIVYLEGVYAAGGGAWFDVAAAEPYGFDAPPSGAPSPGVLNFRRAELLRKVMQAHGDASKPLWLTFYGWNSPVTSGARPSPWKTVTPEAQARYAAEAVEYARAHWPWASAMFWGVWQPNAPSDDPRWGFALMTPDGRSRPVLDSLCRAISDSNGWLGAGRHRADDPALRYDGGWRVTPLGADIGKDGDELTIPFVGRGIAITIRRGEYRAYFTATVDGKPAPALPRDGSGQAYLILYDPLREVATVPLAQSLSFGRHLAKITAHRGWGQWALKDVVVLDSPMKQWGFVEIALFLAATVAFFLGLWLASWGIELPPALHPAVGWGLALVAFVMPFAGSRWYEVALWALFAVAVASAAYGRLDKSIGITFSSDLAWPTALLGAAFFAVLAASRFGVANREFRVVFLDGFLLYLLAVRTPFRWHVLDGWMLGGAFVALWGLAQAVTGHGLITAEGVFRIRGPYGSPNNLALYLERVLPLMLAVVLLGANKRRQWVYGVLLVPVSAALFLTFSRGALLLGIPVALLFLGVVGGWLSEGAVRRRLWAGTAVFLLLALLAMFPFLATPRFRTLLSIHHGTGAFRVALWKSAWKMFLGSPWFGVGPDNFLYRYRTFYMLPWAWREPNLSHPHNVLLDFATRLGIPGLLAGAWLAWGLLQRVWRGILSGDRVRQVVLLGLAAGWCATLAHGMVDNSIFLPDLMAEFMLTAGIAVQMGIGWRK